MITKISKLKNFGSYQNFTWGALDDFKNKNLIYGWNYSGKTTLSKLFQNIELSDKDKYFPGSEFEVSFVHNDTAKSIDQNSIETFPFNIKVFNSEYIKRVFTWDKPNEGFSAISFYLGDPAGNLIAEIADLENRNTKLINIRDNRYQRYIKSFDEYTKQNGKFSQKSKEIRDNYLPNLFDQNSLNKSHIKTLADAVKGDINNYILSTAERGRIKKEATDVNNYEHLNEEVRFTGNLIKLHDAVKNILEDTAPKSVPFPELDANRDLFNWVQTGISLHKDSLECKFCTKLIPENRIQDLNSYYSIKLQEIQQAIEETRKQIADEKELFKIDLSNKKDLAEAYQSDYQRGLEKFQETVKNYKKQLRVLEADLKKKEGSIFTSIASTPIEDISLDEDFNLIETALQSHNKWRDKFDERKKSAIQRMLRHYVAEYLNTEGYVKKEAQKVAAEKTIADINASISSNNQSVQVKQAQLSDKVKGQKELNRSLQTLLHNDQIKIEIRDEKFTLERSGHPASNLSEGEKSAIAFSYFLTELKALRDDAPPKLPNTIVFIDDPISSLDSNHIFQIRSLLKEFFKTDDFIQLFISTHNFEFFSIMYDSKIFSKKQDENKRPLYFVKKDKTGKSSIEKMPKSFSNYKSEYVGIFNILLEFHKSTDKDNYPNLLLLPNALRRFVELYTLTKYPGNNDSTVDNRVEIVFNPEQKPYHNTKLLNWFSHQNQIEKIQQHDDKILQIEDAVKDLMEHIEQQDELHWKGLNGIYV